jgi:TolA-binding protein
MFIFPPFSFLRPRAGASALLLCSVGCVGVTSAEITPLKEEVSALRQAHEADRKRIEALEVETGLQQAEIAKLRGGGSLANDRPDSLPIVHLQPRSAHDLPAVPTATPLREPSPEALLELQKAAASGSGDEGEPVAGKEEADTMFSAAFEKLKTGELVGAAGMFHTFAQKFPHHPAADNAMLDEGIADYGLRRYQDALDIFDLLAKRYPAGDAVPEALWRSGDCHLKLNQPNRAQAVYETLIKRYPASPEATKAIAQIAALEKQSSHVASTEGGSP